MSLCLVLLAAGRLRVAAQGAQQPDEKVQRTETATLWRVLEGAYKSGRASGNLLLLKEELLRSFRQTDVDRRLVGLRWINSHSSDFSADELDELGDLYIQSQPLDAVADSLRKASARRRLANASREERARVYWAAVRDGQVVVSPGDVMTRVIALGMAAQDGLEEFEVPIRSYAAELNEHFKNPDYGNADYLALVLRFRAGAENRADALRLHAIRLGRLSDTEFRARMNDVPAFREASLEVAATVCHGSVPGDACREMARIYGRQLAADKERRRAQSGVGGREIARAAETWMPRLTQSMEGALATLEIEKRGPARNR